MACRTTMGFALWGKILSEERGTIMTANSKTYMSYVDGMAVSFFTPQLSVVALFP